MFTAECPLSLTHFLVQCSPTVYAGQAWVPECVALSAVLELQDMADYCSDPRDNCGLHSFLAEVLKLRSELLWFLHGKCK